MELSYNRRTCRIRIGYPLLDQRAACAVSFAVLTHATHIYILTPAHHTLYLSRMSIVQVDFVLRSVLVAGQCADLTHKQPPNGLQLSLHTVPADFSNANTSATSSTDDVVSDTLVMQNLGYWQLKAMPGVYRLRLASGRASELYTIVSTPETEASGGAALRYGSARRPRRSGSHEEGEAVEEQVVVVSDFTGPIEQLAVRKHAGMEKRSLLEEGPSDSDSMAVDASGEVAATGKDGDGLWSSLSSLLGSEGKFGAGSSANETIHVFSLASGHLYERFLRIMMLSVVKRTSQPVKFWLVENFLSPQFKQTIGRLAEQYVFGVLCRLDTEICVRVMA